MLIDWIINFWLGMVAWLIGLLPSAPWTYSLSGWIGSAFGWVNGLVGGWVPVGTLVTMVGMALTFEAAFVTVQAANWVFNKIRGAG